jgi:hypothetical protein
VIDRIPNPWGELPRSPPIVAPVDAPLFARHPEWADVTTLLLNRLPSPFSGALDAPVLMLGLNPSGKDNDSDYGPGYTAQRRLELRFAADRPYISLNPTYANTPGYGWHHLLLRTLITAVGGNDVEDGTERVARGLLWLQLFGYQCAAWRSVPRGLRRAAERGELPSQAFAFQVLRDAIGSGKTIIVARSFKEWTQSVPELTSYDYILAKNKRRPFVTPNNLVALNSAKPGAAFDRVVAAIRNHATRNERHAC